MKIEDESILFFSKIFLSKFSLETLFFFFMSKRDIYTRVRMECEESGFSKQDWLAAWPHGLTESRVPVTR